MSDYIESLRRLKTLQCDALLPGHGDRIDDPERAIDWIIEHRLLRESRVLAAVQRHPGLAPHALVPYVYQDVSAHLFPLAERSLVAHLLKLERDGRARSEDDAWIASG
jgi:glyoxylase-like metal-dependent hydrolase (beta-lactamase superfamily II)